MSPHTRIVSALVLGVALLLSGCGAGADTGSGPRTDTSSSAPTNSAPTSTSEASTSAPAPSPSDNNKKQDQQAMDAQLRQAAWDGDVEAAAELIAQGADVNAQDETQQSAFLIAASEGPLEMLRLALQHGADLAAKDSYYGTALIRAAERGLATIVGELLVAGIEQDHVNASGYQAIHEAVWYGDADAASLDTVRVLIAGGVDLDTASGTEQLTPQQMATAKGFDDIAAALTTAQEASGIANPDASLLAAAESGDADQAAAALRAGANLEVRDDSERTPLLIAATYDRVDVARLLVAMDADPDALDNRHDTPWLVTGVTGSVPMAEALRPANPDVAIKNRFGGLSIHPASERGHLAYVEWVVQTGIDVNHINDLGWTALLEAIVFGDGGSTYQQIVTALLEADAEPSIADANGNTPRQLAQEAGYAELAQIIAGYE